MERWTRFVLRHSWAVLGTWLPAGLARIVRVTPSPLGEHRPAGR